MLTTRLRRIERWLATVPKAVAWTLMLCWYALIFVLSHRPAGPGPSGTLFGFLLNLGHAPLFAGLGFWMVLCATDRSTLELATRGRRAVWILAAVVASGVLDELHQSLRPGRNLSVLDLATDGIGAAAMLWVLAYPRRPDANDAGLFGRTLVGAAACAFTALAATAGDALGDQFSWL